MANIPEFKTDSETCRDMDKVGSDLIKCRFFSPETLEKGLKGEDINLNRVTRKMAAVVHYVLNNFWIYTIEERQLANLAYDYIIEGGDGWQNEVEAILKKLVLLNDRIENPEVIRIRSMMERVLETQKDSDK